MCKIFNNTLFVDILIFYFDKNRFIKIPISKNSSRFRYRRLSLHKNCIII